MELTRTLLLLASLAGVSWATTVDIGCDPGWYIQNGNCYLFNNQKKITWDEALSECNRYDSSALFLESKAELAFFINITRTTYPSYGYWTSMNDIANNDESMPGTGHWNWGMYEHINTALVQWSSSPANDGKAACGGVNLQGKMYDADCNSRQGFVCMIDNGVANGGCPMGWLNTDTDCFFVSNTSNPAQLLSWAQAAGKCTQMAPGAHLFDLDDPTFLINQLPYMTQTSYLHWTALKGTGQAGGWQWFGNTTFNTQGMYAWAVEPDGVAGKENCGMIRPNGKFSDRGCKMQYNYVCKKAQSVIDSTWNLGCGLWTRAGGKCYQFYTAPKSTWAEAKGWCTSFQGDLMNIDSIDLKQWLISQMQDPANTGRFYWTALNDRAQEGVYKWGDGSALDPKTVAWNQEPNNWMGWEDCAYMFVTGEYNDVSCTFHSASLCEVDNVQSCPSTGGQWVSRQADSGSGLNCYLFGQYKNASLLMTWNEASDYCKSMSYQKVNQAGGVQTFVPTLYAVNSAAERTFINAQMAKYSDNGVGYWTALNDRTSEGFWQFGNNMLSDVSFVVWNSEPNNKTPDTDCVGTGFGGYMYVRKCSYRFPFICERAANLPWGIGAAPVLRGTYLTTAVLMIFHLLRLFH